jgi:hypothetical protein
MGYKETQGLLALPLVPVSLARHSTPFHSQRDKGKKGLLASAGGTKGGQGSGMVSCFATKGCFARAEEDFNI